LFFRISGGGRIRDAVRSLICSQRLFETKEVMIIHHTDCGFTYFSNNDQILASLIVKLFIILKIYFFCFLLIVFIYFSYSSLFQVQTGTKTNNLLRSRLFNEGDKPDFMPIMDVEQSIRDDMAEYKQYPLLNQDIIVRGFLYETKTGLLKEIK
jgi:carbonic anhydrase